MTQIKEMVQMSIEGDEVLNDRNKFDLTREQARERSMAKIAHVVRLIRSRSEDAAAAAAEKSKNSSGSNNGSNSGSNGSSSSKENLFDASLGESDEVDDRSRAGTSKSFEGAFYDCLGTLDPSWAIRIGVHFGLFQSAITGSGTDEQIALYARDIVEMRIIGCFAMTEMGHGSNVGGLETTATYDPRTQEFVIHSPTLTATKWWIGLAGQTATHAAVFARLIIGATDHGVHTFVVPLRDLATGATLPDVLVGDMGSKMGRNGLDNGWIRFQHKRVPRQAMLMRWAKVSPQGHFTPPPSKQVAYNALIGTRVELFATCATVLKKALTIAVRYSLVRRQFPRKDSASASASAGSSPGLAGALEETKLLDYPTHQAVLFPILAHTFALHFAAGRTQAISDGLLRARDLGQNLASLPELHATAAGLKAVGTWYANEAIESCRQSLGGLGYSSYAGLAAVRADFAVMCTWEGDNTVLALQCARFLLKQCADMGRGQRPGGVVGYLAEFDAHAKAPRMRTAGQVPWRDPAFQLHALRHRAARKIHEVTAAVAEEVRTGGPAGAACSFDLAVQNLSVECMALTRMHCYAFMLQCFNQGVDQAPKELQPVLALSVQRAATGTRTGPIARALSAHVICAVLLLCLCLLFVLFLPFVICACRLRDLFALSALEDGVGDLLEDGYLAGGSVSSLRQAVRQLLREVRPHALPLVDAFNLPDFVIDSPLGRADGDVYTKVREKQGQQRTVSTLATTSA